MGSPYYLLIASVLLSISMSFPVGAGAQDIFSGFSGYLDLNYTNASSIVKDSSGQTVKSDLNSIQPRFSLTLNTAIFPNLRLYANGLFEKTMTVTQTDDVKTRTTDTRLTPYISLTFSDRPFAAGVSYTQREETLEVSHTPSFTRTNEEYNGTFGWHPDGLPWLDVLLKRTNIFDEEHSVLDNIEDYYALNLKYLGLVQGLDLRYSVSYDDRKNNLNRLEVESIGQTGKITYSNSFLNKRVNLNTNYVFNQDITETSAEGTGSVSFQVFPFGGLSVISNTPAIIALIPNSALIDGNLVASSGIDLVTDLPPVGDIRPRNMGLDFFSPTEINSLLVWVDRDVSSIASSFLWDVYISSDNLNWSLWAGAITAPFGPFQNRFELNFPNVSTRYIKVVTTPRSPRPFGFPNIFVTEVQAFINKPVSEVTGARTKSTSHYLNLDTRTRILDVPYLYHTLSLFYRRVEPSGNQDYDLFNSLSVNHRFSRIFSGSGRVGIENTRRGEQTTVSYLYDASLTAEPFRTLSHNLVYSGRTEETQGKPGNFNSIFLNNNAELYKGIDVNLSAGYSLTQLTEGGTTSSTTIIFGSKIVPHPTMNISLDYNSTTTKESGGGQPSSSTTTNTGGLTLTYMPLQTLRLLAQFNIISGTNQKTDFAQNYGINWSPFPDGALQFNFDYNENRRNVDHFEGRTITPGVRWKLGRQSFLNLSYQWAEDDSDIQSSRSRVFNSTLKIFF